MAAVRRGPSPTVVGYAVAAVLVLSGLATICLGWRGAAGSLLVGEQLAWLVSGAITGVCLVATGAVVASATQVRQGAAAERAVIDRAAAEADALLDDLLSRR
jgi:hypothetical protein